MINIWSCACLVTPLRVGWRGGSFSQIFTPSLWSGCHLTIFFLQGVLHTPWILEKTWRLRSILEGSHFRCFLSDIFPEEAPKVVGKTSLTNNFCAKCWGLIYARSLWRSLLFSPCCWYPPTCMSEFSSSSLYLVLTAFLGGIWSSRKDCFALVSGVTWSLLPASCFDRLFTDKVSMVFLTYLRRGFCHRCLSSYSMRRRG